MEPETSVILESCGEDLMLIQTVKNIVTHSEQEGIENDEEFFLVTDMQEDQQRHAEATSDKSNVMHHSEEKVSWSELCRVCANANDHLIPIFDGEGIEHELCNKIHKYLPIHVSESDTLPLQLCYHCAATLLAWHELAEGCLNAERRLLEMQNAFQEKHQYLPSPSTEGLHISTHSITTVSATSTASISNIIEPLPHNQQIIEKDDGSGDSVTNDLDRSSSIRTSFKAFLEMQNVFWKPYKRKCQPAEKKSAIGGDCDSVWIAVMDSTLDQPSMMSDQLQNNDLAVKDEVYEEDDVKTLKTIRNACTIVTVQSINDDNIVDKLNIKHKTTSNEIKSSKKLCSNVKTYKDYIDTQESYRCIECGKCFKLKDSYLRHMRIHKDERPYTCHVCGKQFRDSGGLSRHLKDVHAKVKNFTCDICGKSFASKATRDDHRRTHTGERPYICDSCGKTFKSKASLYIHSKLHTNEFPHPCSYCNKKFRRRQEMLAHVTTHTGEKNYGCDICSKKFRVKSELVRHKLIHSESKPFVCIKCGLAFRQKRYLNNHAKSRHVESLRTC